MSNHRLHRNLSPALSFENVVEQYHDQTLSLQDQEHVINSLSNDSCSNRGVESARRVNYFSTGSATKISDKSKYIPTSLRNKVIYYDRQYDNKMICKLLCLNPVEHHRTKQRSTPRSSTSAPRPTANTVSYDDFNEEIPPDPISLLAPLTPFEMYAQEIVGQHGVLKWRIHSHDNDVIVMNDIDISNGMFLRNSFVHFKRQKTQNDILYTCTCRMAETVRRMQDGGHCCHERFFILHLEPIFPNLFNRNDLPDTPIGNKIRSSLFHVNHGVVKLGENNRFHRFSVMDLDLNCAIVKLESHRFSCQNGRCRAERGHTRKIPNIEDGNTCTHIQALWANNEIWRPLVGPVGDEEDGGSGEDDEPSAMDPPVQLPSAQPSTSFKVCIR